MSCDAWIIGFGIAVLLRELHAAPDPAAYSVFVAVIVADAWLLYRFFTCASRAGNRVSGA